MTNPDDQYPRLDPTDTTIKDLFAKSGNRCAFPGCLVPVVDELGTLQCQVVHIKAVKPSAPRFDVTQTPEDRRHPSNLLVMCNPHHKVTDDEKRYPVEELRRIKETHEGRFAGVIGGLQGTLDDQTKHAVVNPPETMSKYGDVMGLSPDEAIACREMFAELLSHLAKLPPDARSVLATIVDRGSYEGLAGWSADGAIELLWPELREVLGLTDDQLRDQLAILKHHGLAEVDLDGSVDSLGASVAIAICKIKDVGEYVLGDLKETSGATGIPVVRAIVGLDFGLLDG